MNLDVAQSMQKEMQIYSSSRLPYSLLDLSRLCSLVMIQICLSCLLCHHAEMNANELFFKPEPKEDLEYKEDQEPH